MNVSSLDKMEKIVSENNSLTWEGWTVLESKVDDGAWMKVNGSFVDGKWNRVTRYEPETNGWNIPDRFVK
jgi:hypothetical protein